ncbi:MAG: molecular chaperone TorD family protein [Desulfuromonadaceae bacterium]|nr:molecular chaperone TorD family protein [Desulfuromonadaceae bacterium]
MNNSKSNNHADFYGFLAQSFRYPEQAWLGEPYFDLLDSIVQNLDLDNDTLGLRQTYCANQEGLEILQIEYTRLFINATPSVIAPPYSSVYLDQEGNLYGPSAVWVRRFYQQNGFELAGDADIPDHLALELEFIALLIDEHQEEVAEQFLNEHFRRWFPLFRARVLSGSTNKFYSTLLTLVDFFTREEP